MTRVVKAVSLPLGSPALQWVLNVEAQGGNFSKEMRKLIETYSSIYDKYRQQEQIIAALKMQVFRHSKAAANASSNGRHDGYDITYWMNKISAQKIIIQELSS
jgi:ABC-type enterochelin transport system substrate-binding protein